MAVMRPVDRRGSARLESMPPPLGGWNTRDPIAQMPAGDAARFRNLVSDSEGVALRRGHSEFAATGGKRVDFLESFDTPFGQRFLAASNKTLYDITSGTATSIHTGFARDDWKSAVMNNRMGLVNGADDPLELNFAPVAGVTRAPMTLTGPSQPQLFKVIHVFKSRSYFATGGEPAFWYSAVNALGGTLTKFPTDRVSLTGGNVTDIKSWTVDGGDGPDDYFVLFLDSGEVIVYQGSNPGDITAWSLVGRFQVGSVITTEQFAGQIHAVTNFDYNAFPRDFQTQGVRPPSKLSGAAKKAVKAKGGLPGWQILFAHSLGLKIVNVPQSQSEFHQHVVNLSTGAPSLFTGLNASRWAVFKGELYFGDMNGKVNRYEGTSDGGSEITWEMFTAPNRLKTHLNKNVLEYRSVVSADGELTESTGIAYDYNPVEFLQESTTESVGTPWNTSPWGSPWSDEPQTRGEWLVGGGAGQAVQFYSTGSVKGFTPKWHSIDFLYEPSDPH